MFISRGRVARRVASIPFSTSRHRLPPLQPAAATPFGYEIANLSHAALPQEELTMYTIAVVLIILWLLGLVTSYTLGGLIHILLVLAVISVLVRVIQGRNAV
jgi:hypothetical protein